MTKTMEGVLNAQPGNYSVTMTAMNGIGLKSLATFNFAVT